MIGGAETFVLTLVVIVSMAIGALIGALATISGYRHRRSAEPPNPPPAAESPQESPKASGRHSHRPNGPERRTDHLEPVEDPYEADPYRGPARGRRWDDHAETRAMPAVPPPYNGPERRR